MCCCLEFCNKYSQRRVHIDCRGSPCTGYPLSAHWAPAFHPLSGKFPLIATMGVCMSSQPRVIADACIDFYHNSNEKAFDAPFDKLFANYDADGDGVRFKCPSFYYCYGLALPNLDNAVRDNSSPCDPLKAPVNHPCSQPNPGSCCSETEPGRMQDNHGPSAILLKNYLYPATIDIILT